MIRVGTETLYEYRFCTVCGGCLYFSLYAEPIPLFECYDCKLVYIEHQDGIGISNPKDCLNGRLEALEKKVGELDREAMMYRPLG